MGRASSKENGWDAYFGEIPDTKKKARARAQLRGREIRRKKEGDERLGTLRLRMSKDYLGTLTER